MVPIVSLAVTGKITIDGNKPCLVLVTRSVRWTLYFKGTTSKELIADQKESYNLLWPVVRIDT